MHLDLRPEGKTAMCVDFVRSAEAFWKSISQCGTSSNGCMMNRFEIEQVEESNIFLVQASLKKVKDISKYIHPPQTTEYAILFLPAESLFSDTVNYFPHLLEYAYQQKVWISSPSTILAIMHSAQKLLKTIIPENKLISSKITYKH